MNNAGPTHTRDMTRACIDPVEVPDRFTRLWIMVYEKSAAVLPCEDAGESPGRIWQITDVEKINDHQIAGFGSFDPERPAQIVDLCEVDVADVVGAIVRGDLPSRPVEAFDSKLRSWFIRLHQRNVGMPSIMRLYFRRLGSSLEIGVKGNLRHFQSPLSKIAELASHNREPCNHCVLSPASSPKG